MAESELKYKFLTPVKCLRTLNCARSNQAHQICVVCTEERIVMSSTVLTVREPLISNFDTSINYFFNVVPRILITSRLFSPTNAPFY